MLEGTTGRFFLTKDDFAAELARLKRRAGLSVRELSDATGIPSATLGGYLAGRHLPPLRSPNLDAFLDACGASREERDALTASLNFLRRGSLPPVGGTGTAEPDPGPVLSLRPPLGRLAVGPRIRGREALLASLGRRLGQRLAGGGGVPVHVLYGLGGSGKTTVALRVAAAFDRGRRVWWVNGADPAALGRGMAEIAHELGGSRRLRTGPDQVWRLLEAARGPWLLIVDGVEDPQAVLCPDGGAITDGVGWLRPVTRAAGAVLVTTSDGSAASWAGPAPWLRMHRVGPLERGDGALVLSELAGRAAGSRAAAEALSERLGGLPLALRLIGRLIAQARALPEAFSVPYRTFDACGAEFDVGRHEDVFAEARAAAPDGRRTPGKIARWAWERSVDLLSAHGDPETCALLFTLTCFTSAPIPHAVLRSDLLSASPLFPAMTEHRVWRALTTLADFGLIERFEEPHLLITLHPLVIDACRRDSRFLDRLDDHVLLAAGLLAAAAAAQGAPGSGDPRDPASWPTWALIVDHCLGPVEAAAGHPVLAKVLHPARRAVEYLRASGDLARAEVTARTAARLARTALGDDHPGVLGLAHEHHRIQYGLGRLAEAAEGFDAMIEMRGRVLGPRHPDTLMSRHYRARVARDMGDGERAEEAFAQVLALREQVLGEGHRDTLTSRNNLAAVLAERGRLDEAEAMLRDVLHRRERALGAEHPATLVTLQHLARLRLDRGEEAAAVAEFDRLAVLTRRVLGAEHPRTLAARHLHAVALRAAGRPREAADLLRDVLDVRSRVLGDDHPATGATRGELRRTPGR